MTPEKWQKIEPILNEALELEAKERAAFLAKICKNDEDLQREIQILIDSYDDAGEFIEEPIVNKSSDSNFIEQRIGAYLLKKEIGRGGMGAVYLAERADGEFRQQVAIKLIKRGMDTDFVLNRFRNERQILASLNHPNIARLFDGGTTSDNLPYFVMEYIEGDSITSFCKNKNLTIEERLRLFLQVCSAVSHAHQRKVIHRDIKPSNVLVTDEAIPKLLDFGIAKLLDASLAHGTYNQTTLAFRLMTPQYASPEQIQGEKITAASDQYSLGALLYEIITGKRPYKIDTKAPHEIARIVSEYEPVPPSQAVEKNETDIAIADSLDAIVLKSLRKNPTERYTSVQEFANDIEHFLENRPLKAEQFSTTGGTKIEKTGTDQLLAAVLPFKLLGTSNENKSDDEFIGVGLADALIIRLSKISRLTLRPTSSVIRFLNKNIDSLTAAHELNVEFVVEGTIRRVSERFRVTAQLLNATEGTARWAESFDEKLTDVLELEDLISTKIAEAIVPHLTTEERRQLEKRGTNNAEAYEAYLRGRAIWHSYTEQGLIQARDYFQKAVDLDPHFAAAHSGIADFYIGIGIVSVIPSAEAFQQGKVFALRAIELDPNLAEAYASLGLATWAYDWQSGESERLFRRCFELNDNYAQGHEWFAHVLASQGRFDEAIYQMHRALEIDPQSSQLHAITAFTYHNARRHREGVQYIEEAARLDPNNYIALQGFGWMYPPLGKSEEAIPYCQKAVQISNRAPICLWILAQVYLSLDKKVEAQKLIDELIEASANRYVSAYYLGMLYTTLGDFDQAFSWLNKALDDRDYWIQWLPIEYRFDSLRQDKRFTNLLNRLNNEKIDSAASENSKQQAKANPPKAKTEIDSKQIKSEIDISISDSPAKTSSVDFLKQNWRPILATLLIGLSIPIIGSYLLQIFSNDGKMSSNSKMRNLTNNTAQDIYPRVSPDGKKIVFASNRDGTWEIYTMNSDGNGDLKRLTFNSTVELVPAWTSDGKQIVYDIINSDRTESELWIMNTDGTNQRKLPALPGYNSRAAVSPDSKQIAFACKSLAAYQPQIKPNFNICLMNLEDNNQRQLTDSPFDESEPFWSPDGKRIVFSRQTETKKADIFVMDADGNNVVNLTNTPEFGENCPAWSHNGKMIAFQSDRNLPPFHIDVWIMNADGSQPRVVTDHKWLNGEPSWQANDQAIFFNTNREVNEEIYLINISDNQ